MQTIQIMFKDGVYNYPYTPVCVAANRVYSGYNSSYATSACQSITTDCTSEASILYRCFTSVFNYTQQREGELQAALSSFFLYNGTTVTIATPLYMDRVAVLVTLSLLVAAFAAGILAYIFTNSSSDAQ